ncbi:MAG: hypothetical protein D6698_16695, partial [Gammaproteobacteria bacterium]
EIHVVEAESSDEANAFASEQGWDVSQVTELDALTPKKIKQYFLRGRDRVDEVSDGCVVLHHKDGTSEYYK